MRYERKRRVISALLAVIFIINFLNMDGFRDALASLRAYADASDYSSHFMWNVTSLSECPAGGKTETDASGKTIVYDKDNNILREFTLTDNDRVLVLKEHEDENPVLKTTFTFDQKGRSFAPGEIVFTIEGMKDLLRSGDFTFETNDPNITADWSIGYDKDKDVYTITNSKEVNSNSVNTFAWQFRSRAAVSAPDSPFTLNTTCRVKEHYDDYGEDKTRDVTIATNSISFAYESVHDDNQVKIVCEDLSELDTGNLNSEYEWRSYRSVLGLKGLHEYDKKKGAENRIEYAEGDSDSDLGAHYIEQKKAEQEASLNARGIKTSDYYIYVDPGDKLNVDDILILDSSGSRVAADKVTVGDKTLLRINNFTNNKSSYLPGESYSSVYRIGVLKKAIDAIAADKTTVTLTGHYDVTYEEETEPVSFTDTAAHELVPNQHPEGQGGIYYYINKRNQYEQNYQRTEVNGVTHVVHSKPLSPVNQLLFESVFTGKTVTYSLDAKTMKPADEELNTDRTYDLVYEDGAPWIENLLSSYTDSNGEFHEIKDEKSVKEEKIIVTDDGKHQLTSAEYDFKKVKVCKLIDGDTVGPEMGADGKPVKDENQNIVYKTEEGFDFDVYAKVGDSWEKVGDGGNTVKDTEVFLPDNTDDVRVVVKNLKIDAPLKVLVDIQYNVSMDLFNYVFIDNKNDGTQDNNMVLTQDENEGTRLRNEFTRTKLAEYDEGTYSKSKDSGDTAYSLTWLREAATTVDSGAAISRFSIVTPSKGDDGVEPPSYYLTNISASGKVYSDNQRSLNSFAVVSKLPAGLTPTEDYLNTLVESFKFSGTLQGTGEQIDENFVKNNGFVSFSYDEAKGIVVARFDFDGVYLDGSKETSVSYNYPASISINKVRDSGLTQNMFTAETYVTVLDSNVKLSPAPNKSLVVTNPYNNLPASKSSATVGISAYGSSQQNKAVKMVSSSYTDWVNETTAVVDGSNTDHLDTRTNRMTSEYTYLLSAGRTFNEQDSTENLEDPILFDVVEGLRQTAWKGSVKSVSFKNGYYPEGYEPEVYYLTVNNANLTDASSDIEYKKINDDIKQLFDAFKVKSDAVTAEEAEDQLEEYHTLRDWLTEGNDKGWQKAVEGSNGEWTINADVYAVAVLYKGTSKVKFSQPVELKADLNMKAPELVSGDYTNNNRVSYNNVRFYAKRANSTDPNNYTAVSSVSDKTLVVLRHMVQLVKVSSKNNDKRLTGAQFSVFTDDSGQTPVKYYERAGSEPQDMTEKEVDQSGTLNLNLSPGVFYYKEVKAPQGYELDSDLYRFRVVSDSNAVYYYTVDLKDHDKLSAEYLVVNDKEYTQYESSIYSGKSPVSTDKAFHVYDGAKQAVSTFKHTDDEYEAGEGTASELNVDNNGLITIKNLPAGTYFFGTSKEDKDGYSFSVADNSSISLRVMEKSPLSSDVVFNLYESSVDEGVAADDKRCSVNGSGGTYTLDNAAATDENSKIIPGSQGKVSITGLDQTKRYYLKLVDAPTGFKKSTVYELGKGITEITKYACEQLLYTDKIVAEDDPIEIAKASFIKKDGTMIGGAPAGQNGVPLKDAEYVMYVVNSDATESPVYFRASTDETDRAYRFVGTEAADGLTTALSSSNGDNTGKILVEGIPYGTYIMQETKAPSGYELSSKRYTFHVTASTIDANGSLKFSNGDSQEQQTLELTDDEILSSIVLTKQDKNDNKKFLKNASYKLFSLIKKQADSTLNDEEYLAEAKKVIESAKGDMTKLGGYWEEKKSAYTDTTGQITFSGLPYGTYLLYEDMPPKGYTWNNDLDKWSAWTQTNKTEEHSQIIVIDQDSVIKNSEMVSRTVTNEEGEEELISERVYYDFYAKHLDDRRKGSAMLIKKSNEDTPKPLKDASFTLYRVNFTDDEIRVFLRNKGLSDTAIESALADKDTRKSAVEQMTKYDVAPDHVSNGKAAVTDEVVKQGLRTNSEPDGATEVVSGLDWGTYYFLEVKAPAGYQVNSTPQLFTIDASNSDTTCEVTMGDEKIYGEVWLYKQAKEKIGNTDDHKKLFGAQFELYDSGDKKVQSLPKLRLAGLEGDGGQLVRKEFIVKSFDVKSETQIEFKILDDNNGNITEHTINVTYDTNNAAAGKIVNITADDAFKETYGNHLNETYQPAQNTERNYNEDMRLAYYVMTADKSLIYDDGIKNYRAATNDEKANASDTYVTADEGGRLNIRGLDWDSYYFHETVPPIGYGLSEDVIFSVNAFNSSNQFIKCEDPVKQAVIIVDKHIPDTSYFNAYGEPTFLFKVHGLTEENNDGNGIAAFNDGSKQYYLNGKSYTLAIHMSDNDGSAMLSVPEGQYLIEELPVSRYSCTWLELVGGNAKNDAIRSDMETSSVVAAEGKNLIDTTKYRAFCDLTGSTATEEILTFRVKYTNEIKRYDNFSEVTFADNRIPGEIYVTAFKPTYDPLVGADKFNKDTNQYTIDLTEALAKGDFRVTVTYNNGVSEPLTEEKLANLKFDPAATSPFNKAELTKNSTDHYILTLTLSNSGSNVAGQTFTFNVGYGENLTAYDIGNTKMVRGSLALTFDEVPADVRKRVVFKTDANNRSIFNLPTGEGDKTVPSTAQEIIYTKSAADDSTVSSEPATFTELTPVKGYALKYWYLLDDDGKPVTGSDGKIVQFKDEKAVQDYILGSTAPANVTFSDGNKKFSRPDKINGFTFQAELTDRPVTARFVMDNKETNKNNKANTAFFKLINKPGVSEGTITDVNKDNMIAFLEGDQAGWDSCSVDNRLTYDSWKNEQRVTELDDDYPDLIRFYAKNNAIYWYTVDRYTYKPTRGTIYAEQTSTDFNCTPNLFYEYTNLEDVSGMFDWELSGMNMLGFMFQKTKIKTFTLNRPYKKGGLMYMSRMFYLCGELTSVSMEVDTSGAGDGTVDANAGGNGTFYSAQTKEMFYKCSKLNELNLSGDFRNLFNAQKMFDSCNLPADKFKRAFSTWQWHEHNNNMQNSDIFESYTFAKDLQNVDLVDANGNHFKRDGNKIVPAT